MSRAVKINTVTENGIPFDVFECFVGDDAEKGIKGERCEYKVPANGPAFAQFVKGLGGESLDTALDSYAYGWGLKARSAARPGGGGITLPEVMTQRYGKLNLVTGEYDGKYTVGKTVQDAKVKWEGKALPLKNRLNILNSQRMSSEETGKPLSRAVALAIEELVKSGKVKDQGGVLVG